MASGTLERDAPETLLGSAVVIYRAERLAAAARAREVPIACADIVRQ
jgi:hypothetical protein